MSIFFILSSVSLLVKFLVGRRESTQDLAEPPFEGKVEPSLFSQIFIDPPEERLQKPDATRLERFAHWLDLEKI